jgi:chromosome partitioning protein
MYDGRTKLADQVAEEVRNHFGDLVLRAVIPRNVRVSEAPGYGQSVLTYDPGSRGSTSYVEAAREVAERGVGLRPLDRSPAPGVAPVAALAVGEGSVPPLPSQAQAQENR